MGWLSMARITFDPLDSISVIRSAQRCYGIPVGTKQLCSPTTKGENITQLLIGLNFRRLETATVYLLSTPTCLPRTSCSYCSPVFSSRPFTHNYCYFKNKLFRLLFVHACMFACLCICFSVSLPMSLSLRVVSLLRFVVNLFVCVSLCEFLR